MRAAPSSRFERRIRISLSRNHQRLALCDTETLDWNCLTIERTDAYIEVRCSSSLVASLATTACRCRNAERARNKSMKRRGDGRDADRKKMTKNANFSPRPATKGCCTIAAEDKSLPVFLFLLLARSHVRHSLGSRLGVSLQPGIESNSLPTWTAGHRVLSLLALIYTTSGRIYWPQNTMRTCPCPSTETGSRPLVVYLFAVAIHIRPLRHGKDEERRKKRGGRERTLGVFCAWSSRFCASAARAKEVAKQMAAKTRAEPSKINFHEDFYSGEVNEMKFYNTRGKESAKIAKEILALTAYNFYFS